MQSLAWLKQLGLKLNMTEQIRYANTAQTSLPSNDEFVKFFTRYAARYGTVPVHTGNLYNLQTQNSP